MKLTLKALRVNAGFTIEKANNTALTATATLHKTICVILIVDLLFSLLFEIVDS